MSVLRVEDISKTFAGLHALSDVSLELSDRTILGLIGPNGSGKTTLLNVITGVLSPDHGRVLVDDTDSTGWGPDRVAHLGIARTFQVARTFAGLSVQENIETAVTTAALPGLDVDQEVALLLERLGLMEWANSMASVLPYGIQRRLEIARALGIRPKFLLLDEPAAGLNDEESDKLLTVITDIRSDPDFGCAILIIDHDLRLIMRLCDSIHVLNEGKTIAEGTPKEIRSHPKVIESYLGSSEIS